MTKGNLKKLEKEIGKGQTKHAALNKIEKTAAHPGKVKRKIKKMKIKAGY